VLSYLLPEGLDLASLATGAGLLGVQAENSQPFNAALVSGGPVAFAGMTSILAYQRSVAVQ
jgi:hypothetical protein